MGLLLSYKEKSKVINQEFGVLAYPNFAIISKGQTDIELAAPIKTSEIQSDGAYMKIPTIYVDAAYVAAGIIVSTQNKDVLRQKDFKLIDDNPNVHFDIEKDDNCFKLLTCFNRETKLNRDSETSDEIIRNPFGFVFCCDGRVVDGRNIDRTYVQFTRTLNGMPICQKLVNTYIFNYIVKQIGGTQGTEEKIQSIVKEIVQEIKKQNSLEATKNSVNNLLDSDKDLVVFKNQILIRIQ